MILSDGIEQKYAIELYCIIYTSSEIHAKLGNLV